MPAQKGWEELIEAAEAYNGEDLVTILGSEPTIADRHAGHMNVYYFNDRNRPVLERLQNQPKQKTGQDAYKQFTDELERSDGEYLLLPHAHSGPGPANFQIFKKELKKKNEKI